MKKEYDLHIPANYKTGNPVYLDVGFNMPDSVFIRDRNIVITNSTVNNQKLVFLKISKSKWPDEIKVLDNITIKVIDESAGPNLGLTRNNLTFFPNESKHSSDFSIFFLIMVMCGFLAVFILIRSKKVRLYFIRKRIVNRLYKLVLQRNKKNIRMLLNSEKFQFVEDDRLREFSNYFKKYCFREVDQNEFYNHCIRLMK